MLNTWQWTMCSVNFNFRIQNSMYQLKLVQEAFATTQFGIRITFKLCVNLSRYRINIKNDWNPYKGEKKIRLYYLWDCFSSKGERQGVQICTEYWNMKCDTKSDFAAQISIWLCIAFYSPSPKNRTTFELPTWKKLKVKYLINRSALKCRAETESTWSQKKKTRVNTILSIVIRKCHKRYTSFCPNHPIFNPFQFTEIEESVSVSAGIWITHYLPARLWSLPIHIIKSLFTEKEAEW